MQKSIRMEPLNLFSDKGEKMHKTRVCVLTLIFLLSPGGQCLRGDSIWAKRNKNMKALYSDDVARQIGDILTIVIVEDGKIENQIDRSLSKTTSRTNTFNGQLGIVSTTSGLTIPNKSYLPRIPAFNMTASSANSLTGNSTFNDERKITDEITVVVVDIQPNGNLVVLGKRERTVAGDTQMIQASGIVRPSDITFTNTVKSEQVANFSLVMINKGYSAKYNRPGWLGQIFDFFWPF